MIRSPAGFDGGDRIKRYLDYYQPSYGVMMLSAGQFSPASLFAAGEQGAWYDPSDFTTMFQDSAGATPVTAVEQPVGRILDKSGRGNTATQATSASRPVLSAKVNMFLNSRLNNGVSGSPGTAPTSWSYANAGTPAYTYGTDSEANGSTVTIVQDTTQRSILRQSVALLASTTYIVSAVVDVTTAGNIQQHVTATSLPAGATITYQLNGSTVSGTTAIPTGRNTIALVIAVSTTAGTPEIRIGAGLQSAGVAASLIFRQVQIESGSTRTTYQWTNTSTDYDTTGFPLYLRFDGTDDSLATSSIDFSATDKMSVFAGIRKLSDAASAAIVELSVTGSTNSGSFTLLGPTAGATDYLFRSRGNGTTNGATGTPFVAPITNVLSGLGNISGDSMILRANGAQVATNVNDQGTGNFGNYPLYIGRRAGTSLPFNGRLYSLIVRGAQSTSAEITNTETWVNGKTMAY
jgi:hypothetical protein